MYVSNMGWPVDVVPVRFTLVESIDLNGPLFNVENPIISVLVARQT